MQSNFLRGLFPFLIAGFIVSHTCSAQTYQWVFGLGGTTDYDKCNDMALDNAGNLYVCGTFGGPVDFDPGSSVSILTTSGITPWWESQGYVAKYNPSGALGWAFKIGANTSPTVNAQAGCNFVRIDGSGDLFIAGNFNDTVDFDPGPGIASLASVNGKNYLAKYTGSGTLLWVRQFGNMDVYNIQLDHSDNIIVSCEIQQSNLDFDPGPSTAYVSNTGISGLALVKYDNDGNFLWVKPVAGRGLAIDEAENIYLTDGIWGGTFDLDPGPGTAYLNTPPISSGLNDMFIAKYDSNGVYQWANLLEAAGSGSSNSSRSIVLDHSGHFYISGFFADSVDFDPAANAAYSSSVSSTARDIFVAKYDTAGIFVWVKTMGGTEDDVPYDFALDRSDNFYLTGIFNGIADFDPDLNTTNLISLGNQNIFVAKYDSSGAYKWAKSIGDLTNGDFGNRVRLDSSFNVYISGIFEGTADFNPGGIPANIASNGDGDIFVAKYAPICLPQQVVSQQTICNGSVYTLNGHNYTQPGSYLDTLQTTNGGCDSIVVTELSIDTIDVSTNVIGNAISANATNATYQWLDCADYSPITGATTQTYTPMINGSYAVAITKNGCADTSECIVISNLGVTTSELSSGIRLYPNPNSGSFTVDVNTIIHDATLAVFGALGNCVQREQLKEGANKLNLRLVPGIYFIEISSLESPRLVIPITVL